MANSNTGIYNTAPEIGTDKSHPPYVNGRGVGTRWSLRSPPTQAILWFSEVKNPFSLSKVPARASKGSRSHLWTAPRWFDFKLRI